jgi:anti-anti-sigma factor
MRPLTVSIERDERAAVVRLGGDLDISGDAELRRRLRMLLDIGCDDVAVDLSALRFCDLPGVRALVDFARDAAERRASVVITGAHGQVERILDLTQARGVLPLAG